MHVEKENEKNLIAFSKIRNSKKKIGKIHELRGCLELSMIISRETIFMYTYGRMKEEKNKRKSEENEIQDALQIEMNAN